SNATAPHRVPSRRWGPRSLPEPSPARGGQVPALAPPSRERPAAQRSRHHPTAHKPRGGGPVGAARLTRQTGNRPSEGPSPAQVTDLRFCTYSPEREVSRAVDHGARSSRAFASAGGANLTTSFERAGRVRKTSARISTHRTPPGRTAKAFRKKSACATCR